MNALSYPPAIDHYRQGYRLSSIALPVGVSIVLHVGAWALVPAGEDRSELVQPSVHEMPVRSLQMDVDPLRPPPPPEPPEVVEEQAPASAPPVTPKPPPPKDRKPTKSRRKIKKVVKTPPVAAPVVVQSAEQGKVVAVDADPNPSAAPVVASPGESAGSETETATPGPPTPSFDLTGYGEGVRRAVQRQQRYPVVAEQDGIEGRVVVKIRVGRNGRLVSKPVVKHSSGHPSLDREAVRMVQAAAPFRALPGGVRDGVAELELPIVFELDGDDF
ncbi:MAG TPA: hypothetical protein DCQ06_13995 [Myxococcales bacterium]|nr:hypothetical protein [Myxococcales bacterium]